MAPTFVSLAKELRDELAAFEPELSSGSECAFLVDVLAVTEKACAAARVRAAARAADCGAHRDRGFRDPEDWLARTSGSSTPDARSALNTARLIDDPMGRSYNERGRDPTGASERPIAMGWLRCPSPRIERCWT